MESTYLLRQETKVHQKGIRSLCVLKSDQRIVTGGYDGLAIVWSSQKINKDDASSSSSSLPTIINQTNQDHLTIYQQEFIFAKHKGVVYSVCDGEVDPDGLSTFLSGGGDDKQIFWVTSHGKILQTFTGHTGAVCSLCCAQLKNRDVVISGSWDTTARIWEKCSGSCLYTLTGHHYAVFTWHRPSQQLSDLIITGSQDANLHLWEIESTPDLKTPLKTFRGYHDDIIRSFSILPMSSILVSCSNDGSYKAMDLTDYKITTTKHVGDSFLFAIASYKQNDKWILFTASENGVVDIWNYSTSNNIQSIPHSSSVWSVAVLENGDLLTGCEDGFLRIWTTDENQAAPIEEREQQRTAAIQAHIATNKESTLSPEYIKTLPDITQLTTIKGNKAGQHKLYRDGDKASVYVWNGHKWEFVGEALGQQPGGFMGRYFEGDDYFAPGNYDYIFDVEIGNDETRSLLPYRVGENSLIVAEKFCARENISKSHITQIEEFIKKNSTRAIPKPSIQESSLPIHSQNSIHSISQLSVSPKSKHFPPEAFLTFRTYNAHKIKEKILEFNELLDNDSLKMSDLEKSYLDAMIIKLDQKNFVNEHIRLCEMDLTFQSHLIEWPPAKLFPVFDLWRVMVLHPQSTDLHKKSDGGWHYVSLALKLSKSTDGQPQLALCCMRYLANLFEHPTNRAAFLKYETQIIETLPEFPIDQSTRHARSAEASIFVNLCLALGQTGHPISLASAEHILLALINRLQNEIDENVRYYLFVAVGTLLYYLTPPTRIAISQFCQPLKLQTNDDATSDELRSVQHDVITLLY